MYGLLGNLPDTVFAGSVYLEFTDFKGLEQINIS